MPDLTGKIVIVTGGGSGFGKETVKVVSLILFTAVSIQLKYSWFQALLEHNAVVYIAARNETKTKAAIDELQKVTGKTASSLVLDLEDLHSVRKAAEQFIQLGVLLERFFKANVTFSNELARRYGNQGIVSSCVNPGNLKDTGLSHHVHSGIKNFILKIVQIYPPAWGALPQLFAGTSPEGVGFNGKFIVPWGRLGPARKDTRDPKLGRELWTRLEEQVQDII
ncbi:NAD-P-binding protein [Mycena filopes]|nr:NAD-P-binding protein [Mycena filopes]